MKNTKAIVTMTLGDEFVDLWQRYCRPNWEMYARRHGYDIINIDAPLDDSERAQRRFAGWQKCLILRPDIAGRYERVVWMDSDIVINPEQSPCIASEVPPDMVGAVDAFSCPTSALFGLAMHRYAEVEPDGHALGADAFEYYLMYGFPRGFAGVVQSGVLVLSNKHRQAMEDVYDKYEEKPGGAAWHGEMRPLSYELLKTGLVHWIDNRFNVSWPIYKCLHYPFLLDAEPRDLPSLKACVNVAYLNNYFLHFPGNKYPDMTLVEPFPPPWRECSPRFHANLAPPLQLTRRDLAHYAAVRVKRYGDAIARKIARITDRGDGISDK
jgi:hypothetical protein